MAKTPKFANAKVFAWVDKWNKVCTPDKIVVVKGTKKEHHDICEMMVKKGQFVKLNPKTRPDCYLARSHESDVARVEGRTFICSKREIDAGPTNHWMEPEELQGLHEGPHDVRDPVRDGPDRQPDHPVRHRDHRLALRRRQHGHHDQDGRRGAPPPRRRRRLHPLHPLRGRAAQEGAEGRRLAVRQADRGQVHHPVPRGAPDLVVRALLGKKCFALRIASKLAKDEGWMAEHMLILTLTSPERKQYHLTAAFPSACGKTNLAMMLPKLKGWKLQTIGDDIAWLKPGEDGRLYAINPENGFFGVAPGTSMDSNPNALKSCKKGTIFTNVVLTPNGDIWWEDMGVDAPVEGIDWKGNPCYRCVDDKRRMGPRPGMTKKEVKESGYVAAHKNSRFTAPAENCPVLDKAGFDGIWKGKPTGVPIDAILFGGRRPSTIPLVNEAKSWTHGVFMGSAAGSEVTAAVISDQIGQVRRDPMAMLPFFGYNVCDYFQHWLEMERTSPDATKLPKIYFVNWFRKGDDGRFMWPGFGDNSRVLKWICQRIEGKVHAHVTPIGNLPLESDIDLSNNEGKFKVVPEDLREILKVDREGWKKEIATVGASYDEYDAKASKDTEVRSKTARRVPKALRDILASLASALNR